MNVEDHTDSDTLGILLPDEIVEKFGLKEGDIFELFDDGHSIELRASGEILAVQMRTSERDRKQFTVVVQDLTKLA